MQQGSLRQSVQSRIGLCFRRMLAAAIDLALLLVIAVVAFAPIIASLWLAVFGYLENFGLLYTVMVDGLLLCLIAVSCAFVFLLFYYPCHFESSDWQGTLGKYILGLRCSSVSGQRQTFGQVARHVLLQLLIVGLLLAIVSLVMSGSAGELIGSLTSSHSVSPAVLSMQRGTGLLALVFLLAPYLMALLTPRKQTLADLMTGRLVRSEDSRAKLFFPINSLPSNIWRFKRAGSVLLLALWAFPMTVCISAFLALPVCMLKVEQLATAADSNALRQYNRDSLFSRLDLIYGLLSYGFGDSASSMRSAGSGGSAGSMRSAGSGDLAGFAGSAGSTRSADFRRHCLSIAIMLNPDRYFYWYWQAQIHYAEKQYKEALADISQSIQLYDKSSATIPLQSMFGTFRVQVVPEKDIDEGSLYSMRASVYQQLGDSVAASENLTRAISTAAHADDYKQWLALHQSIRMQKESEAKIQLAKATAIANDAYKILLKSPARFQAKKDIYNQIIKLNNDGVDAIARRDYDSAIKQFKMAMALEDRLKREEGMGVRDEFSIAFEKWQAALDLNKRHDLASRNLSIAYNGKAESADSPELALIYYHSALYFDPLNEPAQVSISDAIRKLGLDPDSFGDHVRLAESAAAKKDFEGAAVEYGLALKIRDDAEVRKKLTALISHLNADRIAGHPN
ncbi:MAG: RDD family protein [Cyanobacteria bacterium SZAS LIN-5]|nr:RDD family protein [Cyanobacteria bacterium SZAS LIN-5]